MENKKANVLIKKTWNIKSEKQQKYFFANAEQYTPLDGEKLTIKGGILKNITGISASGELYTFDRLNIAVETEDDKDKILDIKQPKLIKSITEYLDKSSEKFTVTIKKLEYGERVFYVANI